MKHYFSKLLLMVMFIPWVLQAQTTPAPASLPYTCGFEDAAENANWTIVNGSSAINKFYIGTAAANGGTQSLYVSNDNGVSNTYTSSSAAAGYVYAYREFTITSTGFYTASFDWRCKGESTFDFLRVFLIPDGAADTLTPCSGTAAHTGITASASPASWIPIDNNVKLNLQDTWQSFASDEFLLTPGIYKFVVYWRADVSTANVPAGAIDNISFTEVECPAIYSVNQTVTDYSATISWSASNNATSFVVEYDTAGFTQGNGQIINVTDTAVFIDNLQPNTKYELYVQTVCGNESATQVGPLKFTTNCLPVDQLPYVETFDSYTTDISTSTSAPSTYPNHTLPSCWNFLEMGASGNPQIFLSNNSTYAENGNCLFFRSSTTPVYAVMPKIDADINMLQLSFTHRHENLNYGTMVIGVMTSLNPNSFIPLDTIRNLTAKNRVFHQFWADQLPEDNYRIAFRWINSTSTVYYIGIDSVVVDYLPSCPDPMNVVAYSNSSEEMTIAWSGNASGYIAEYGLMGFTRGTGIQEYGYQDSINIYGLNPATAYDVYLRSDCGGDTGNWIGPVTVRTACPEYMDISENPYIQNFDAYTAVTNTTSYSTSNQLPDCWDFYSNGTTGATAAYWPRIYKGTSYCPTSNDNALLMYVCNYVGTTASSLGYVAERGTEKMAVLPIVSEPLSNVTVSFDARVYTVSTSVIDTIFVAIATSDSTYIPLTHFEGV
ncbi:MAG: fibronectin type III domain-containing protein [Bacteroidales bacterium]|nr:fibronectin type III domain-containing protein [Bacteroidales bacterium]